MSFDDFGNLLPYGIIESSLEEVERELVKNFEPQNSRRKELWVNLAAYNERLKTIVGSKWEQWLNGSFVTKKIEPRDIDVVNFVHYNEELNQKLGENWEEVQFLFAMEPDSKSGAAQTLGIDGHLEPVYPINHPLHIRYQKQLQYWNKWFSKERESNRLKGFLSIRHA